MKDMFYKNKRKRQISKSKKKIIFRYSLKLILETQVIWKIINEIFNKKPNKNEDTVIKENGAIICNQKLV